MERIRGEEGKSYRKQLFFCRYERGWHDYLFDGTKEDLERIFSEPKVIPAYTTHKTFEHAFKIRVYNPHPVMLNLGSYFAYRMGANDLVQMEGFTYHCELRDEQCKRCEHWEGGPFEHCKTEFVLDGFTCQTFLERVPITKKTFIQIILEFLGLK